MEQFVNQDHITLKEHARPDLDDRQSTLQKFPDNLSTSEIIFQLFFFDHKKQGEIAKMLYVSKQYVSRELKKQKEILKQNLSKTP
jgi:DNA-directed RNA polymerase specialized sigma subunit